MRFQSSSDGEVWAGYGFTKTAITDFCSRCCFSSLFLDSSSFGWLRCSVCGRIEVRPKSVEAELSEGVHEGVASSEEASRESAERGGVSD